MKHLRLKGLLAAAGMAVLAAPVQSQDVTPGAVLTTYADIAHATYSDSLATARTLSMAVDRLVSQPSEGSLRAARAAWLSARAPYQQTEAYRFGNPIVDDWEGKVNAWPLDEGLIDYVDAAYGTENDQNPFYAVNVIANPSLTAGGKTIEATKIDAALIRSLHEIDEVEANVATGYHAIEFLLWGQDLNGTQPGAGNRPWTDYAKGEACTGGKCARRGAYLKAATALLVSDLEEMAANWAEGGAARAALAANGEMAGLGMILTGLGSLSYGELAGERMKLGLMLHDPEEEHDCFSDNTHNSHYYDAVGIMNVFEGRYVRIDGTVMKGASIEALAAAKDAALAKEARADIQATVAAMAKIKQAADRRRMSYDQMIAEGNERGNKLVQDAIDGLVKQTRSIERLVAALGLDRIEFEGSDSLDNPTAVFQ
ncbi:MAG: imelysin family protein [Minwuia sp.]|uniref:imelysin family protein n=1 Tax=Minwuia sp. TaxID=2493630 RepID=UPI003A850C35